MCVHAGVPALDERIARRVAREDARGRIAQPGGTVGLVASSAKKRQRNSDAGLPRSFDVRASPMHCASTGMPWVIISSGTWPNASRR
jgi:hypothetical protein